MKKNVLAVILIITAGVVWAQSPRAIIRELQGTVEIKAPGASSWKTAVVGQELTQETLISTGFKSEVLIELGGSTLQVRPLTRLSLGELQAASDADKIAVQLRTGRIRAYVKPEQGRVEFTVRSSIATASVRGTVFDFDTVNLRVDEGTVSFSGADNTAVYVAAGQSSSLDSASGRTAAPVETVSASAPPPPAGVEEIAAPPPAFILANDMPISVKINWNGQEE